ncbi:MAG: MotA/TolQ/ExbB proton channel family protein [Methylococcaceae bacterium]|nr:MotA/TolQ/ExbB proton channel family protein [Methylococcaceae bacterium]
MFEIIVAGGWVMGPIIASSIVAMAIICERLWALRAEKVIPRQLATQVWNLYRKNQLDASNLRTIRNNSALGAVIAAGIANYPHGREVMKESLEQAGRQVVHQMGRYLNTLGTIASISPYLGLLGSVLGMIKVFSAFSVSHGLSDPMHLAGGISEILITTASGLVVAIPSLMFHRYFEGRVDELALQLEQEALHLIEMMHGEREE